MGHFLLFSKYKQKFTFCHAFPPPPTPPPPPKRKVKKEDFNSNKSTILLFNLILEQLLKFLLKFLC